MMVLRASQKGVKKCFDELYEKGFMEKHFIKSNFRKVNLRSNNFLWQIFVHWVILLSKYYNSKFKP